VDIWALGGLLYECLTGEVPFRANNYLGIISQVLNHVPVPPSQLRPELGIPEAVEAVVMHAMEKDRARRAATMGELERDLERLLAGDQNVGTTTLEASAVEVAPRAGLPRWHLGLAAGLALIGGAVLVVTRPSGSGESLQGTGPELGALAAPAGTVSRGAAAPGMGLQGGPSASPMAGAASAAGSSLPASRLAGGESPAGSGSRAELAGNGKKAADQAVVPTKPKHKHIFNRVSRHVDPAPQVTQEKTVAVPQSVMRGVLSPHSPEGYPDSR